MKTREEVEQLKRDWVHDPCWEIEDTVGFEEYKDELAFFSREQEVNWELKAEKHHAELAAKICPMLMNRGLSPYNCKVEKCAWWNAKEELCAIAVIGRSQNENQ